MKTNTQLGHDVLEELRSTCACSVARAINDIIVAPSTPA